jgi:hypothetical protein
MLMIIVVSTSHGGWDLADTRKNYELTNCVELKDFALAFLEVADLPPRSLKASLGLF